MSELAEAEATYKEATEQIAKWGQHSGSFAEEQVALWREVQRTNAWCLPGASAPTPADEKEK